MSLSSFKNMKGMSRQCRRDTLSWQESLEEIENPTNYRWVDLTEYKRKTGDWDMGDYAQRIQFLSYLAVHGYYEVPMYNSNTHHDTFTHILSIREELWGQDDLDLNYEALATVAAEIDFDFSLATQDQLLNLVNFTQKITNGEEVLPKKWQLRADWLNHCWGKKLVYSFQNLQDEKNSLTTEQDPDLKNYSFDPLRVSKDSVRGKLGVYPLLGVELEFTSPSVPLYDLIGVLAFGVFKSDSTTDVEWVSVPLEYEELKKLFQEKSPLFDKMLSSNGYETNGMHVHASRQFISLEQEARIYYLINARKNRAYWSKMADRTIEGNQYCDFPVLSRSLVEAVTTGDYSSLSNSDFPHTRGITVNRTKGQTLEFRFFKSPDNTGKVIENLDLAQAILDYTKAGGYTLPGFISYLKGEYPDRGILKETPQVLSPQDENEDPEYDENEDPEYDPYGPIDDEDN